MDPPGLLHVRVLRRPTRTSRLQSLDEALVRRIAGDGVTIVRSGDFVAVAAEDEAVAERALSAAASAARWSGSASTQARDADPRLLQDLPSIDRVVTAPSRRAGMDVALRAFEATYTRPYLAHASIGPSCALATFDGTELTVWSHSQGVGPLRV